MATIAASTGRRMICCPMNSRSTTAQAPGRWINACAWKEIRGNFKLFVPSLTCALLNRRSSGGEQENA